MVRVLDPSGAFSFTFMVCQYPNALPRVRQSVNQSRLETLWNTHHAAAIARQAQISPAVHLGGVFMLQV